MATDRPDDKVLLSVTADGGDGWAKGPEAADGHTGRDDEARPTVEEGAPPSPDGAPDAAGTAGDVSAHEPRPPGDADDATPDPVEADDAADDRADADPGQVRTETPATTDEADPIEADPIEADPGQAVTEAPAEPEPGATGAEPTAGETAVDRWEAFAPQPERAAGRVRRLADRAVQLLGHEWSLAAIGSVLLAAVMTWPTLRYPTRTIPEDIWDPTLQAWQMAWSGHALTHDPANLWNSNAFYPEKYSFAFSDTLLGYAPVGMIGTGPVAALFRYNVMYVLVAALAFFGAYALVRQLGGTRVAAAVAGAAFGYAPWRLGQAGHMHVLSTGGIALSLAMLARGHGWSLRDGYRPVRVRPGWALAGWLVATWQITIGFGIGLPFGYVLGGILVAAGIWWLRRRHPFGRRLLLFDAIGAVVFVAVVGAMAYPYLKVVSMHPEARRGWDELSLYSPPLRGFLIAPPESMPWGNAHAAARAALPWAPEMSLLPGFTLIGLATAGLVFSIWTVRQRALLGAGVVVSVLLAMGSQAPDGGAYTYRLLYDNLPGFDSIRTTGRLVVWTTLLLAVLAAGTVSALARRGREVLTGDRVPGRPESLWRLATLIPLVLVLAEGLNHTPHPVVPPAPAALAHVQGPVLVLPSDQLTDENIMLWTTRTFPKMVNGGSGFTPTGQNTRREEMKTFPDQTSVQALRDIGVHTVVVLRDRVAGTPYQGALDADTEGLDVDRQEMPDAVIFTLR